MIHELFGQQARLHPEKTAVRDENAAITYRDLDIYADKLSGLLRGAGLEQGDITGVLLRPGITWVAAILAIFKAGLIYLPLSRSYPRKKLLQIYEHTRFKCLLVEKEWQEEMSALFEKERPDVILSPGDADNVAPSADVNNSLTQISPEDGNYIIYTSGSTGAGKAIMGCHKGLVHFIKWQIKEFRISADCRVSQLTSMVFDASFRDIFLPLSTGGTLCIPGEQARTNMQSLIEWLEAEEITVVHCVPSVLKLITRQLELSQKRPPLLRQMRTVFLAGEPLYTRDITAWRESAGTHVELVNLYGTSETTMAKTFKRIKDVPKDPAALLPAGKPIDNTTVAVINQNRICRIGELGEVYIKTPYWTKGYYKNDELNRKIFVQNPLVSGREDIVYRTGDMGRYKEDGDIEVIGRTDDQVKVNGIRIELGEIEQAVLRMTGIREVVIKPRMTSENMNELICYYTSKDIPAEDLREFLRKELSDPLVPAWFVPMSEFPLTLNGKIDRKMLPEPERVTGQDQLYEPPQSLTEQVVEGIWKEVLFRDRIGRNEPFFQIGGNSLKAIRVISRISVEFNVLVKVVELFNNNTIAKLSRIIERTGKGIAAEIPTVKPQLFYELSRAQKRLWTLYQVNPESFAYNIPEAYLLEGPVDWQAIRQSFDTVIRRHEILRTNFVLVNGEPGQKIHPVAEVGFDPEIIEAGMLQDKGIEIDSLLKEYACRPFVLESGPLFKALFIKLDADRCIFFLNMHHIITDSWSREIFFRELLLTYGSIRDKAPSTLPPLKIQYKEFAVWYNRKFRLPEMDVHRQYWISMLQGNIQEADLPIDLPRPAVRTADGGILTKVLDEDLSAAIHQLNTRCNATPYIMLMAAIRILLFRLTGQQGVIIGTPWTCRTHPELENQLGFFVNILMLLIPVDGEDTLRQVIDRTRAIVAESEKHQEYPFDMLMENLQYHRRPNRLAPFDVAFDWHSRAGFRETDAEFAVSYYPIGFNAIKADLWFHGYEDEGRICVSLEYSSDLFRETTGIILLDKLEKILIRAVEDDNVNVKDLLLDMPGEPAPGKRIAGIEFNFSI